MPICAADSGNKLQLTVIDASDATSRTRLLDAWRHRELLWFLALRDVQVRYKQTVIGIAWAVVQPAAMLGLFWLVFGSIASIDTGAGIPYPLFALAGLVPWQLFAHTLGHTANSLVENERLISKVYFPRILLPIASTVSGLVDFAIIAALLLIICLGAGWMPTWRIFLLIPATGLALTCAIGTGLILAALNVRYRDIRYTIGLLTQAWMLATPIAYPRRLVPEHLQFLYNLNPLAGAVELFRTALFGMPVQASALLPAVIGSLLMLAVGLWYFQRAERSFADQI